MANINNSKLLYIDDLGMQICFKIPKRMSGGVQNGKKISFRIIGFYI